jgi:hypothetical protein
LFGAARGGPTPLESIAGVTDFLVGALVVGLVAARRPDRRVLIGGALAGVLMDLAEYVPPFGPWFRHWAGAAWLTGFHHQIQHNLTPAQWVWGSVTQAAAFGLGLAVCLAGRRTRAGSARAEQRSANDARDQAGSGDEAMGDHGAGAGEAAPRPGE